MSWRNTVVPWVVVSVVSGCGGKARIDGSVDALSFSSDTPLVIAGSSSGSALVVNDKGKPRTLPVTNVARWTLSADGREAIGAAEKGFVVVNVDSGAIDTIAVPGEEGEPWTLHRGPHGDLAVTKMVQHWRVHRWLDGNTTDPQPLSFDNLRSAWLDDGGELFFVDTGYGLEVRDLATGGVVRSMDAPGARRYVDAVLDEEQRIVVALWDDDGFRMWAPPEPPAGLWNLAEDADVVLAGNGTVAAVATDDGAEIRTVTGQVQQIVATRSPARKVALSGDGHRVAVAAADGTVIVDEVEVPAGSVPERQGGDLDPGTVDPAALAGTGAPSTPTSTHELGGAPGYTQWVPGGKVQAWLGSDPVFLDPVTGDVSDVGIGGLTPGRPFAWSSDGSTVAFMEGDEVGLYQPRRRGFRRVRRLRTGGQHSFLEEGGGVLVVDTDANKVQAWSIESGEPLGEPFQVAALVLAGFEVSPDGSHLVTIGDLPTVFSTEGKQVATLNNHLSRVSGVGWSPDGKQLATIGNDALVVLWDTATWQPFRKIEGLLGQDVVFSPDGLFLMVAGSSGAQVVDLGSGKVVEELAVQGSVTAVDWGSLGKVVATSVGSVYVWL